MAGHEADEQVEVAVAGDRRRGPGAGGRHWDPARVRGRAASAEGGGRRDGGAGGPAGWGEETDTAAAGCYD